MDGSFAAGAIGHTGHGDFGHGLHRTFRLLPSIDMVAVADPDEDGRREAKAAAGSRRSYASYAEMLDRETLDIVAVCPRHTGERVPMVTAATEAGCHIYCEKPMASSLTDADAIVEACERADVKLTVAHSARYVEPFSTARQLIAEGKIGEIVAVYGRGKEDHRGGGEDLIVLGTHTMDLMRYLTDANPEWVFGHVTVDGRDATVEDTTRPQEPVGPVLGDSIEAIFGLSNGARAHFQSIRDLQQGGEQWGVTVSGTAGSLTVRYEDDLELLYSDSQTVPQIDGEYEVIDVESQPPVESGDAPGERFISRGNYFAVHELVRAIEADRPPVCDQTDGRYAIEMIQGVYTSHLQRERTPIPLPSREHPLGQVIEE